MISEQLRDKAARLQVLRAIEQGNDGAKRSLLDFVQDVDDVVRNQAIHVLVKRPDIARQLLTELASLIPVSPDRVKWGICEVLAALGPDARAALGAIADIENKNEIVVKAIWRITRDIEIVRPMLSKLFESPNEETCDLVYDIGPGAAFLLSQLIRAANSPDADLRWAAVDAISALGVAAKDAIPEVSRPRRHAPRPARSRSP